MAIRNKRKKLLYFFMGVVILGVLCVFGGIRYAKHRFFRDTPNTLTFEGDLHPIPFQFAEEQYGEFHEPHNAILIPVSVPGIAKQLYMQFDTGSPSTFVRSGAMKSLRGRGIEFELYEEDDETRVRKFELNIAGNHVFLNSGRVLQRNIPINWDDPEAINTIGSIGADFIDQKICEIDFPNLELRLHALRPKALDAHGGFNSFSFKGRRIMLPAEIDGVELELIYDSGSSAFGLLTSKYHFNSYSDENAASTRFNANRFGDPVPIHHRSCDLVAKFGDVELPLKRVSYVEQYAGLQSVFGRFLKVSFLGNKSLLESTLVIDAKTNEFLVVPRSGRSTASDAVLRDAK